MLENNFKNLNQMSGLDFCIAASAAVTLFFLPISTATTTVCLCLTTLFVLIFSIHNFSDLKKACIQSTTQMLMVFLILAIVGCIYTTAPLPDILFSLKKASKVLFFPVFLIAFRKTGIKNLYIFLFSIFLTVLLGICKLLFHLPWGPLFGNVSLFKAHIQANFLAAMGAFFCLILFEYASKKHWKILLGIIFLVSTSYVWFLSEGRSGYISYVVLGIFYGWKKGRLKGILAALLWCVLISMVAFSSTDIFRDRILQIKAEYERFHIGDAASSTGQRLGFYNNALTLMEEKPWFGYGTGSYVKVYAEKFGTEGDLATTNPHNEYLLWGVQWGVFGVAVFSAVLLWFYFYSSALLPWANFLSKGVILVIAAGSCFNSWFSDTVEGHALVLLLALAFSTLRFSTTPKFISVIVTTYNWPKALQRVLEGFAEQTDLGFELIIADDGSTHDTREIIESFKSKCNFSIVHCWQEDEGFRAARIRNKAILCAQGDYVVFLDGDSLVRPNFIQQHRQLAQPGFFVAGNRVLFTQQFTEKLLSMDKMPLLDFKHCMKFLAAKAINRMSSLIYIPFQFWRFNHQNSWKGVKTCNLGVWKEDLLHVNGLDERFVGWGYEDTDLAVRLMRANIKRKSGKFATTVLHLWHKEASRSDTQKNWETLQTVLKATHISAFQGLHELSHEK